MTMNPEQTPSSSNDNDRCFTATSRETSMPNPFSELLRREISFRRVTSAEDPAKSSFIDVYKAAYAGPPYFEHFDADFVAQKVWEPHQDQLIIVAEDANGVVGFVCAHRLSAAEISPSAASFLQEQAGKLLDNKSTLYFSELAVDESCRGMGVGSALVACALTWASERLITKFALRTAAEGSNSLGIFQKFGAEALKAIQEVSVAEAGGPASASSRRVYLAGDVTWQGDYLARLGEQVSASIIDPRSCICYG